MGQYCPNFNGDPNKILTLLDRKNPFVGLDISQFCTASYRLSIAPITKLSTSLALSLSGKKSKSSRFQALRPRKPRGRSKSSRQP